MLADVAASSVVANFGSALFSHMAYAIGANLGSALGYHAADFVCASLLLRNHCANVVVANFGSALGYHFASSVSACAAFLLANVSTSSIVANLCATLFPHRANLIAARFGFALGNHFADSVRDCLAYRTANVLRAVDGLLLASRNPNLFAASLRRSLAANSLAWTGAVYASASRRIVSPSTWALNLLRVGSTWYRVRLRLPASTLDVNRLGVRHSFANVAGYRSSTSFRNRSHHCVVDGLVTSFVLRNINRVVDRTLLVFPNRTANRVRNGLRVR